MDILKNSFKFKKKGEGNEKDKKGIGCLSILGLIFLFFIGAAIISGLGEENEPKSTPLQEEKSEEITTAFKLAGIQEKTQNPSQSLVEKFEIVVKSLDIKCPDWSEEKVGDVICVIYEEISKKGVSDTFYDVAIAFDKARDQNSIELGISCEEIVAALITLTN